MEITSTFDQMMTPLELASFHGDIKEVKYYIEERKFSPFDNECRSLRVAAHNGYKEVFDYLTGDCKMDITHRVVSNALKGGHANRLQLDSYKISKVDPDTLLHDMQKGLNFEFIDWEGVNDENLEEVIDYFFINGSSKTMNDLLKIPQIWGNLQHYRYDETFMQTLDSALCRAVCQPDSEYLRFLCSFKPEITATHFLQASEEFQDGILDMMRKEELSVFDDLPYIPKVYRQERNGMTKVKCKRCDRFYFNADHLMENDICKNCKLCTISCKGLDMRDPVHTSCNSTFSTTGSFILTGGCGISESLHVGNKLSASSESTHLRKCGYDHKENVRDAYKKWEDNQFQSYSSRSDVQEILSSFLKRFNEVHW